MCTNAYVGNRIVYPTELHFDPLGSIQALEMFSKILFFHWCRMLAFWNFLPVLLERDCVHIWLQFRKPYSLAPKPLRSSLHGLVGAHSCFDLFFPLHSLRTGSEHSLCTVRGKTVLQGFGGGGALSLKNLPQSSHSGSQIPALGGWGRRIVHSSVA